MSRYSIALLLMAILITSIPRSQQQQTHSRNNSNRYKLIEENLLVKLHLKSPPNILLIISDDQPFYTEKYTPAILNEIFVKGTTFSDAFVSTSLCCPSRASILTGLYAHDHGTITNTDRHRLTNTTFFHAIDTANL